MKFNNDFLDFFSALNKHNVEYIVVGGYAVGFYGYYRYTSDLDIFVNPTGENIDKLFNAFLTFGAPVNHLSKANFLQKPTKENPSPGVSFGREPVRLEIISAISGVSFADAWKNKEIRLVEAMKVYVLNVKDLIINKRETNRTKDQIDILEIEKRIEHNKNEHDHKA